MRPLLTVGRLLLVGRLLTVGLLTELLLFVRPETLPVTWLVVGRLEPFSLPLEEPPVTPASFCFLGPLLGRRPLMEPEVPPSCLTLAT